MPDPALSVQDMKDYGYAWAGVLPVGQEVDVYKRQGQDRRSKRMENH